MGIISFSRSSPQIQTGLQLQDSPLHMFACCSKLVSNKRNCGPHWKPLEAQAFWVVLLIFYWLQNRTNGLQSVSRKPLVSAACLALNKYIGLRQEWLVLIWQQLNIDNDIKRIAQSLRCYSYWSELLLQLLNSPTVNAPISLQLYLDYLEKGSLRTNIYDTLSYLYLSTMGKH